MPPIGPPDRPLKRRKPVPKIYAKRTMVARAPLGEIQQVNNQRQKKGDDEGGATQDAAAATAAATAATAAAATAATAAAVAAAALLHGDENAGAVVQNNANAVGNVAVNSVAGGNADVDADVDSDADGGPVNDVVEWIPDEELRVDDYWPVRLLKELTSKATVQERDEWANALEFDSPYGGDNSLSCRYVVDNEEWSQMRIRKTIIKEGVYLRPGDFVSIRPNRVHPKGSIKIPNDNEMERILALKNDWVAIIIEIRMRDANHVRVLVAWLYWPEDLYTAWSKGEKKAKNGRKGYHGEYELIASNHLDIMDIHSIDDNFNHLIERDHEDMERPDVIKECYYRQFYDYRTGQLSELKRYCGCNKYNKPDQPMVQCTNRNCETWNHEACLVDDILSRKFNELSQTDPTMKSKTSVKAAAPANDINSVHINSSRYRKHLHGTLLANINQVQVTQIKNNIVTNVPMQCLKCGRTFV